MDVFFVLLLALLFVQGFTNARGLGFPDPTLSGILGLTVGLILFGSVLLHELSHSYVALSHGAAVEEIRLHLLGGAALIDHAVLDPRAEIKVIYAGPAANLFLVLASLGPLFAQSRLDFRWYFLGEDVQSLGDGALAALTVVFSVNLVLLALNLLPGLPMDGGRILRSFLSLRMDYVAATEKAVYAGTAIAIAIGVYALMPPPSILLGLLAVFIYLAGRQELHLVRATAGHSEAPPLFGDSPMFFPRPDREERSSRRQAKAEERRQRAEERRLEEEEHVRERVDELLDKISRQGMDKLTVRERKFLVSASKMYGKRESRETADYREDRS